MSGIAILSAGIVLTVLPVAAMIIYGVRTKTPAGVFVTGAVCFILFAGIFESLLHQVVLGTTPVMSDPVLYVIYGCFAAGIFEETGRLFGFRVLLKKERAGKAACAYGLGHGGTECILTAGATFLVIGLSGLVSGIPGISPATLLQFDAMRASVTAGGILLSILERVSAMLTHTGLSMIMFRASKEKGKLMLWPASILIHAAADVAPAMYQAGLLTDIILTEILTALFSAAVFAAGLKILKGYREEEQ